MNKRVFRIVCLLSVLSFSSILLNAQTKKEIANASKLAKEVVYTLASDEFGGRVAGTKGDTLAREFIIKKFKDAKLLSVFNGNNPYSQSFFLNEKMISPFYKNKTYYNLAGSAAEIDTTKNYIIIGAHYDHLGMGGKMSGSRKSDTLAVHNGADDNASGVSGVIALASLLNDKEWRKLKEETNSEVIFATFGGEEGGLIGSKYFASNLPVPASKIKIMINFDMIGSLKNKSLMVGGIGTAEELKGIVESANEGDYFKLTLAQQGYGPSDHSSFYMKKIPVLYITTGVTETYHTPEDDADLINYAGIDSVVNFSGKLVKKLMEGPALKFKETGSGKDTLTRASFKVTLGIMPDVIGTTDKGMKADVVIKDRPAYNAGLKSGDVIMEMDGVEIKGVEEYMKSLGKLKKGDILKVKVLREGKEMFFDIKL